MNDTTVDVPNQDQILPSGNVSVDQLHQWSSRDTALWLLESGYWPVPIDPLDGKKPLNPHGGDNREWGLVKPTPDDLKTFYGGLPGAGVGIKLGVDSGIIDLDIDDPTLAEPVLRRIWGDSPPKTLSWQSNRGCHYLFRWDDRLAKYGQTVIKGGAYEGLEIRIGTFDPSKPVQLQSVCPPSKKANGDRREWSGIPPIAQLPESVFVDLDHHVLTAVRSRAVAIFDGDHAGDADLAKSALGTLNPDCDYDGWIKVGMALSALGDDGLTLWDDWSSRGEKYRGLSDLESHWRSFKDKPGGVGLGTVFALAKERGWVRAVNNSVDVVNSKPVEKGEKPKTSPHRTDLGNAVRFANRHGDSLRYCRPWGTWLVWDGSRWTPDRTGEVMQRAKDTALNLLDVARGEADDDRRKEIVTWAMKSQARPRLDAMEALARSEPGIPVLPESLDENPWLLNVQNGTLDLRTGELRPHRQTDLLTKLAPVVFNPSAKCPRWERFEREVFAGDETLIAYMRRAVGYALTGADSVQEINILWGDGSNGKNVYMDTVARVLGDYAVTAEPGLLLAKREADHPTGLADLCGRRFVAASETDDGQRLAEGLVKRITGDATIKARYMRQDFFEFKRTFKLFLMTNHKPEVRGTDIAIWRRIRLVPFQVTFVKDGTIAPPRVLRAEGGLIDTLSREASGILNLFVRGCLDWQRGGMVPPPVVVAATESYREEMDRIGAFLEEQCETGASLKVETKRIYKSYSEWCEESGIFALSARKFGSELERRGFALSKSNSQTYRSGVGLKGEDFYTVRPGRYEPEMEPEEFLDGLAGMDWGILPSKHPSA